MTRLESILLPFGFAALLAGAGAARAGLRAAADDPVQRFEHWGMCVALAFVALLFAGAAWWWAGW